MEHTPVGAAAPYPFPNVQSIATGRPGVWAFSPSFLGPLVGAQSNIVLTGHRAHDYLLAEANTGVVHRPRVTVWHHVYDFDPANDQCTLQLVTWGVHVATVPHAGGCIQYTNFHGIPYHLQRQEPEVLEALSAAAPLTGPLYSDQELEGFAQKTGRKLCSALQALYSGQKAISQQARELLAAEEDLCLDVTLPLTDPDGGANVTAILKRLGRDGLAPLPDPTALPFAIDPFGNEFWTGEDGRLYFYDHETDTYQAAKQGLESILN